MSYNYTKSLFDDEHEIFRNSYRRFLETEADGHVDEWLEHGAIPRRSGARPANRGSWQWECPEEYGGPGGDFLHRVVIAEELGLHSRRCEHRPVRNRRRNHRDPVQKRLRGTEPQVASRDGHRRGPLWLRDHGTGQRQRRRREYALRPVRDGNEWVISGAKTFIGNAAEADAFLVACKTQPELGIRASP